MSILGFYRPDTASGTCPRTSTVKSFFSPQTHADDRSQKMMKF
jgi:hypothetical protein